MTPRRSHEFGRRRFAHARTRGFTLIEIVVAMLFLTLGVMGVIALFLLGAKRNQESLRTTRATLIALQVREALINAMRYPMRVPPADEDDPGIFWARFELPNTLDGEGERPASSDFSARPPDDDVNAIDGFYFQFTEDGLKPYVSVDDENQVLDLPREARKGPRDDQSFKDRHVVWWFRSTPDIDAISEDPDDIGKYCFRILIRRSTRKPSLGLPAAGDLFAATIQVFKDFKETEEDVATLFSKPENRPIFEYHFYLPGF